MSAGGKNPYKIVDGCTPVSALLYESEELVISQDGVGLYDGYVTALLLPPPVFVHITTFTQ